MKVLYYVEKELAQFPSAQMAARKRKPAKTGPIPFICVSLWGCVHVVCVLFVPPVHVLCAFSSAKPSLTLFFFIAYNCISKSGKVC